MEVITANVSSWKDAQRYILNARSPIMMIQETKASAQDTEAFRPDAVRHGLNFAAHPAAGDANARSGGVLVAWQRHLAVDTAPVFAGSQATL